jgi:biotin carboxyl carrier protein
MRYVVTHEGRSLELDVTVHEDGTATVSQDGQPLDVEARKVGDGLLLTHEGRVYDLAFGGPSKRRQVAAGVARVTLKVESERERAKQARAEAAGGGAKTIVAPMPGRVVRVLVEEGQAVEVGTPCVVVEAMKMENELRAEVAGTVSRIHASEGTNVEADALLVSFS